MVEGLVLGQPMTNQDGIWQTSQRKIMHLKYEISASTIRTLLVASIACENWNKFKSCLKTVELTMYNVYWVVRKIRADFEEKLKGRRFKF